MSWEMMKLGDVLDYEQPTKYIVLSDFYNDNFTTPVLTAGKSFVLGYTNETEGVYTDLPVIIFDDFTTVSKYVDFKFKVKSSAMKILKAKEGIADTRFMFFLLQTLNLDCEQHKRYWISKFAPLQISLPPLVIQKRIAEILDAADALKRKDQALLKKYDELAQAIFIEMFGDPVKNEKGWEVKTIGEVCHYVKDGPHVSPKYTSSGIPFISVNNIIKGSIDLSNSKFISHEDFEIYSKKGKPERNDILYTKGGTTGFAKRVDVDFDFIQWVHVALLKFNQTNLNSVFFEYMLNSSFCYYQSQILTKGIANRDLVLGEIKKIKILFPSINIQQDFERKVLLIEKCKCDIVISEKNSTNLFQTLIQKAFKGELVAE